MSYNKIKRKFENFAKIIMIEFKIITFYEKTNHYTKIKTR